MNLFYKEYRPSEALRSFVVSYWSLKTDGANDEQSPLQRCFPAGTIEWITQVTGKNMMGLRDGKWFDYPGSIFTGICDKAAEWVASGNSEVIGVRLTPEGATRLFGPPFKEYYNSFLDAGAFLGKTITPVISNIQSAETVQERLFLIECFLHNQIRYKGLEQNYFTQAMDLIRSNEELNIADISRKVFVGERQLQRSFQSILGISPKTYQRIVRLYKAHNLGLMRRDNFASIAYQLGYADPAHFNREFKSYFATTPEHYFSSNGLMYID